MMTTRNDLHRLWLLMAWMAFCIPAGAAEETRIIDLQQRFIETVGATKPSIESLQQYADSYDALIEARDAIGRYPAGSQDRAHAKAVFLSHYVERVEPAVLAVTELKRLFQSLQGYAQGLSDEADRLALGRERDAIVNLPPEQRKKVVAQMRSIAVTLMHLDKQGGMNSKSSFAPTFEAMNMISDRALAANAQRGQGTDYRRFWDEQAEMIDSQTALLHLASERLRERVHEAKALTVAGTTESASASIAELLSTVRKLDINGIGADRGLDLYDLYDLGGTNSGKPSDATRKGLERWLDVE